MELKRYVMDGKKYIIDLKDNRYSIRFNGEIHFNKGNKIVKIGNVTKTSDNILDLVEVGDLIETARDGVVEIIGENFYVRTGVNIYLIDIKAIYKRQPNGDYKRYEVKA